jgi:hypothetical protein
MAAYETVHEYRNTKTGKRGPGALAPLVGMAPSTLSNKCNPNEIYANLTLKEARQVVLASGDARIVKQFAADTGFAVWPIPVIEHPADMDLLNAWSEWQKEVAETIESVTAALADGEITSDEVQKVHSELSEDLAKGLEMLDVLKGMMEPDDKLPKAVRQLHKA